MKASEEKDLAGFSDRVVAFSMDLLMFYAGYYLSLLAAFPATAPAANPKASLWFAMWGVLFLIYQAYCSCEGRVSVGKRLLGLRVLGAEGEPLSLGQAVLRAVTYPVSAVMGFGFLWSLFNPARQCWHDLVVGSVVTADHARTARGRVLVRAGALACLSLFAGTWMWKNVWAARYYRIMDLAYAHVGMAEVAQLQKIYFKSKGRYAASIVSLASVSGDPEAFLEDMAVLFDLRAGFDIKTTVKGYSIRAIVKDRNRTAMTFSGP